jgi:hypothetical protein
MKKNQTLVTNLCEKLRLGPVFLVMMVSIGVIGSLIVVQSRGNRGASRGALKAISGMNKEMSTMYRGVQAQARNAGMKLPDAPNLDVTGASGR